MARHAALFAVALTLGCAGGERAPIAPVVVPATPKDVVAAARGLLEQWRQAQEIRSFETLAGLYAHGPDIVVVSEGSPLIGWSSVEAMLQDRMSTATAIHIRLKDVQIASLSPDVASVLATMARELTTGATTVTESGTLTLVLRRSDDGSGAPWQIAAEHYSYKAR